MVLFLFCLIPGFVLLFFVGLFWFWFCLFACLFVCLFHYLLICLLGGEG